MMKINVFEPIGICEGVNQALSKVMEIKIVNNKDNIYLFGPLIHNEKIDDLFRHFNINVVETKGLNDATKTMIISSYKPGDVVIFQAHGTINLYKKILKENNVKFYDLTCPIINATKEQVLKSLKENKEVIFIGKKNHEEAISIMDLSDKNLYLYDIKEGFINNLDPKSDDIDIYFQTTLSINDYEYFSNLLMNKYPKAIIKGNICPKTRARQEKIINDYETNPDFVIVVGSESSSNTNELFKMASNKYHSCIIKRINSVSEIENFDFKNIKEVNVLSGTSALDETVNEIIDFLKNK